MSSGSSFTTNRYKRKPQGTGPGVPAPPAPALPAQLCVAREGEERSSGRGGAGGMGGGSRGVGEPRLPRAPQCGDFYCGAPALRTHARTQGRPASALPGTGRGQGAEAAG